MGGRKVCRYFLDPNKTCWFGRKCRNIHRKCVNSEDTDKEKVQDIDVKENTRNQVNKKKENRPEICKYFMGRGCDFGERCRNIHLKGSQKDGGNYEGKKEEIQIQKQDSSRKQETSMERRENTETCRYYMGSGCDFGNKCWNVHPKATFRRGKNDEKTPRRESGENRKSHSRKEEAGKEKSLNKMAE